MTLRVKKRGTESRLLVLWFLDVSSKDGCSDIPNVKGYQGMQSGPPSARSPQSSPTPLPISPVSPSPPNSPHPLSPSSSLSRRGQTFPLAPLSCSGGSDGEDNVVKWQLKSTLPFIPTPPSSLFLPQRYPLHRAASPLRDAVAPPTLFFPRLLLGA